MDDTGDDNENTTSYIEPCAYKKMKLSGVNTEDMNSSSDKDDSLTSKELSLAFWLQANAIKISKQILSIKQTEEVFVVFVPPGNGKGCEIFSMGKT